MHHCNELVTFVERALELSIAGQTWVVQPGDEVFIPKGAVHSVKNIHTDTTSWLYGYDSRGFASDLSGGRSHRSKQ